MSPTEGSLSNPQRNDPKGAGNRSFDFKSNRLLCLSVCRAASIIALLQRCCAPGNILRDDEALAERQARLSARSFTASPLGTRRADEKAGKARREAAQRAEKKQGGPISDDQLLLCAVSALSLYRFGLYSCLQKQLFFIIIFVMRTERRKV